MNYREVMDLPMGVFWLLHGNIERIQAQLNLRDLAVASSSQSDEAYRKLHERLTLDVGEPVKLDPMQEKRDEAGFAALKALAG